MRSTLDGLGLGDVSLQGFGSPDEVLIRISRQPGGDQAQEQAVAKVKAGLPKDVDYRRVEVVGPSVGDELIQAGVIATVLALAGDRALCLAALRMGLRRRRDVIDIA